ncbi:MAG: ArsA-related P-loop ATPase [Deinococcales bacterium]|jgi:arsenite/tail-anchored protein-transporting ATPase
MITAFLGKGGVGKSSVASAFAMGCASMGRTALVSSDFMPSLSHIFTEGHDDLTVIELTAREVSQLWKERYGDQAKSLLNEVVEVEDWMVQHIAESPGVAEEFMISNIVDLDASGEFDFVVWDTAASSSTMHLLLLQKEFYGHLDRDVRIYLRLKDRLRHSGALDILEEWKTLANRVWSALQVTRFYLVTTMDDLSLIQADEIRDDIETLGLSIAGRIYNRCRPERPQGEAGVASIPELEGSALEVVEKMTAYTSGLLRPAGR